MATKPEKHDDISTTRNLLTLGEITMGLKYIGKHICVITKNANASKSNNGVVIIAHGGTRKGKTFKLVGGTIYFYCPDGYNLAANTVNSLTRDIPSNYYDFICSTGTADCPDYELEKEVTYHAGASADAAGKKEVERVIKEEPTLAAKKGWHSYDTIEERIVSGAVKYDVVSIRNRWFSCGTTLSGVIKELKSNGYGYGEYHCHFCRGADGSKDWSVQYQKEYHG